MDWREFNRETFEKKYKVFAFITNTKNIDFFSEKTWIDFNDYFTLIIEKSKETSRIYSKQLSSDKKGFLPLGKMTYQEKNLIKCIEKYKNQNKWMIFDTQIWSGDRIQIMDENKFPEFVFTIDYTSSKIPGSPVDNVFVLSFELDFYNNHKSIIDSSIQQLKTNKLYIKGFVFIRPWFVGALYPGDVAGVDSRIAGVDGVLTLNHLVDSKTLNWNNRQCSIDKVVEI